MDINSTLQLVVDGNRLREQTLATFGEGDQLNSALAEWQRMQQLVERAQAILPRVKESLDAAASDPSSQDAINHVSNAMALILPAVDELRQRAPPDSRASPHARAAQHGAAVRRCSGE